MHAALTTAVLVAVAEIGDKTQLLALLLASRFGRPVPIILGMLTATLLNHTLAGLVGGIAAAAIDPTLLRWTVGLVFLAMAAWTLVPDTLGDGTLGRHASGGAYLASVLCFFLAEMGDKTQIATVALAARFGTMLPVVVGSTLGMMAVDIPTVLFGQFIGQRISLHYVRYAAAALFALFGILALLSVEIF